MDSEQRQALERLRAELREVSDLESVVAVLEWDQSTYMPPAGAQARGRQIALVGRLAHERLIRPEIGDLLKTLRPLEDAPDSVDGALVRVARRKHERAARLPSQFVAELKNHLAASYVAWTRARPANDFASVRPLLEKTVELSRRKAQYLGEHEHVADPLIDLFDPGMTAAAVQSLFSELRGHLVPLVESITAKRAPDVSFLRRPYDRAEQRAFGHEVVERLGYNFERGRQDDTHHPFMVRFSAGDVRITTRYRDDDLAEGLFSSIHEAGHALYEQGVRAELDGTPLGEGVSAGVHESQSRLWENIVGRSRPFWCFFLPGLKERFPGQLDGVSVDAFHRGINCVERSLIRTDADEVTYNLHVMLRFDLELAMLDGELKAADLPDAWNARMSSDLGVEPPDDRDGVLQDVHWFVEAVGGLFQGYTLGNVMSAQFMAAAEDAVPDVWQRVEEGDFAPLRSFLTEAIYRHGACFEPLDLVERATGRPLSVEPFVAYLRRKYGSLYGLD